MAEPDAVPKTEQWARRSEPVAGPFDMLLLLCALTAVRAFGSFAVQRMSAAVNPSRVAVYLLTTAWAWAAVGYMYWSRRRRALAFQAIAGERWKSAAGCLADLGVAFAFSLLALMVLAVVARLIHSPGMPPSLRNLAPRDSFETALWILLSVPAGICEETIFRGYLQKQFAAWTRSQPVGVLLSAALFGAGRIYQGGKATVVIGVYGLLFGILVELRKTYPRYDHPRVA